MNRKLSILISVLVVVTSSLVGGFLLAYMVFTDAGAGVVRSAEKGIEITSDISRNTYNFISGSFSKALAARFVGREDLGIREVIDKVIGSDNKKQVDYIDAVGANILGEEKAIVANLEDMTLSLFEKGVMVAEYKILSKGRPGSPWETPSGQYEVLYKTRNHFSSIAEVYLPASIQFFGNFFIHGWPYYPDGTPVSEGYSGGCIRLSTEDAFKVFEFAEVGVPIVVYGSNTEMDASNVRSGGYYSIDRENYPKLNAESYLVADIKTGEIIMDRARNQVRPIASITKLMTALVSLEVVNQFREITITREVIETEGTAGNLYVGQRIITGDLIYPLLLESSNDASEALARHYGRTHFIQQMNNRAASIGLKSTRFDDPSGLSPLNVSSANDIFVLTQHIYRSKSHIFDLTLEKSYIVPKFGYSWKNISKLLDNDRHLGSKNGYTDEAGRTVVALYSLPLSEFEDRDIAIILLNTNDIPRDVGRILSFLESNVTYTSSASFSSFDKLPES